MTYRDKDKPMGNPAKIVIVDDEVHIRVLLEQTLEDLAGEPEILTAINGAEGLALIERERPQLIFLDVMMPFMNGYEVCTAVRGNSDLTDATIVMLTAKGQESDRARGLEAGAHHFVTKPFDPDEILALAEAILEPS
ncbi:MAG: CheY-like chemotaxis protein [Rhodocyclaceae bacterium]|nr:CheY-like chemotaxis protein [Rhodocyclaceae bacterium]